jgi:hypothetical protein
MREAGERSSPHVGFAPGLPSYWPCSAPILTERGLRSAPPTPMLQTVIEDATDR